MNHEPLVKNSEPLKGRHAFFTPLFSVHSLAPFNTYTRIPASPRSAHPTRATESIDRFFHRRISIGYYPLTSAVSGYGGARCVFSSKHAPLWWLAFASSVLHGSGPRNWGTFLPVPCVIWELGGWASFNSMLRDRRFAGLLLGSNVYT